MAIERDGARIVVREELRPGDLRLFCALLHQTITEREFSDVTLDFSMCVYATEATMLPMMPIIAKYQSNGKNFSLIKPQEEKLARLFINANWAHHIAPNVYHPTSHQGGHVPALRFGDDRADGVDKIMNGVMNLILVQLNTDRDTLKAVEWSLGEIMDNVSSHARSPVGGFVQATAYQSKNLVEFVVADSGMGIPASMNEINHALALQKAIDEGVTRDSTRNAGNGLYGSYRIANLSGGVFEIHSMHGALYTRQFGETVNQRNPIPYDGTSVRCGIGVGDPGLLDKALRFKGQRHDPPYDYVEREFEDNRGEIIFNMKERAQYEFATRQGGKRVRAMIENLLGEDGSVTLDFNGVGVFSSSFADEVFGRLFLEMGLMEFTTRIRILNAVPTVKGLIDRAVEQRTRLGNGDRRT